MTLRRWSIGLLVLTALTLAGCPDDETSGGPEDATIDGDGIAGIDGGTGDDTDGGAPDTHAPDTGDTAGIELVALTSGGPYGAGLDAFSLGFLQEPAAYLDSPGFQMDFEARSTGIPKGAQVTLLVDGAEVGTTSLDANVAPFDAIELAPGLHSVRAIVSAGGRTYEDNNAITVSLGDCQVAIAPANPGCLTEDADPATPGFQAAFTVTNLDQKCKVAYLEVAVGGSTSQTSPVQLDDEGKATITVALSADDEPVDNGQASVTAHVAWPGADDVSGMATLMIDFDDSVPAPKIDEPAGPTLTMADDEAPGVPGITVTVRGTAAGLTPADVAGLELYVDDVLEHKTTVGANQNYEFSPITFTTGGEHTLRVVGTDLCGLTGDSGVRELDVQLEQLPPEPSIDLLALAAGGATGAGAATITLTKDDEPAAYVDEPGYQMDFQIVTEEVPAGTGVTLVVAGAVLQGTLDDAGVATLGPVNLTKGDQAATATVVLGEQTLESAKTIAVDIAACDILVEPAGGCLTEDTSPAPGFQASITVSNPDGQCDAASVLLTGSTGQTTTLEAALTDGSATFLVTAAPAGSDDAPITITATVTSTGDPSLAAITSPIAYVPDGAAPALEITAPAGTASVADDADADPSNGVQLVVEGTVSGNVGLMGPLPVTVSVDGAAQGEAALDDDGGFSATITVAGEGTFTVVVATADGCGLTAEDSLELVVGAGVPPTIDFLAATANGPVGEGSDAFALSAADEPASYVATPGYQMDFTVLTTGVPEGETATLKLGGATIDAQVDDSGVALFGGVALVKGEQMIEATVTVGGATASSVKTVTLDIAACDLTLQELEGACLTQDADEAEGFQAMFVVGNPDGKCDVATLVVQDTTGATTDVSAPLVGGQATLVVTLAPATPVDGAVATVTPQVESTTDPGLLAIGNAVAVTVDDTAPAPALTEPVAGTISAAADLDSDPANGIQVAASGTTGGADAIALDVDGVAQGAVDVADGAFSGTITFAGTGEHTVTASGTDACGLEGTAQVVVTVEAVPDPAIELVAATANGPLGEGEAVITLGSGDEPATYAADPGYQMDFAALTTNVPEGTTVTLTIGGATLEAATDAAGVAIFGPVNLVKGSQAIGATVTVGTMDAAVSKDVVLDVPACDIVVEPATPGCLTEDASGDEGFQASFVVSNPDGQCDVAGLVVTRTDGTQVTLGAPLVDGEATFVATLSTGTPNGGLALVAGAVDSSLDPGLAAETNAVQFTVDAVAPEVAITIPAADVVLTSDDLDGVAANGVQLLIGGTSTGTAQVELLVDGASQGTATPDAGGAWSLEVTFAGPGAFLLDAQATDGCGLEGSAQRTLGVEEPPIEVAIVSPADGATLASKDDGDPATANQFETTFTVSVDRPAEGSTIQVLCADGAPGAVFANVGAVTLTQTDIDAAPAGAFDVAVALDVRVVGTATICKAAYIEDQTWESDPVSLTVALPAPVLVITAPTEGFATTGHTVAVTVFAENLEGVTPAATLTDADGAPVGDAIDAGPIAAGALSFDLALSEGGTPLADGLYTLTIDATDAFGNVASDQVGSVTSVAFTLDTTAPAVTLTAPPTLLQPLLVAGHADEDGATPGYQTTVSVTVTAEEPIETIEVCLTVSSGGTTCANPAAGSAGVDFEGVTLVPGDNVIAIEAFDALDNKGVTQQTTTLELDAPVVTITAPAPDIFVTTTTVDVTFTVADVHGVAIPGADADLLIGGVSAGVAGTEGPDGTWTFAGVAIAEGPNELQAVATSAGLTGASQMVTVNRKTTEPAIGITTPTDLQTLNIASTVCQTGVKACILDVQATVTNVADDVETTLSVTCGAVTTDYDSVVAAGQSTWTGVALPDQASCTLTASVTDKAGQSASSAPITVSVDRTGPVLNSFPKPTGDVIEPPADEDPITPGIQKKLQVSVTGLEADQVVAVKLVEDGVDPSTVAASIFVTVPTAVSDTAKLTVDGPAFTIATSGFWTIVADVADKAGNPAATLSRTIYFNVDAPIVAVISPTNVEHKACVAKADCGAAGICDGGFCSVPWGIVTTREIKAQLTGIAEGTGNVRVCTDNPANGGGACATPGFTEAAVGDVTSTVATVNVAALQDGLHRIIVEAETFPGNGNWVSSLSTGGTGLKERWITIDTVAPVVTGISSPSDTLPPAMVLNIAEQVGPGNFDFTVTTTDDGQPFAGSVTVYSNAQVKTTLPVAAGSATGVVNFVVDGVKKMQAVVTDKVGNTSTPISNPASFAASYTVKVAPLTLSFSAPTKSPLLATDARDVTLISNQTAGTVTIFDGGAEVASAPIGANGSVTFDHATYGLLADGSHTLTATLVDTANNTVSAATSPATIQVDTQPPGLVVSSPVAGSLTDADDAAPAQGGFQVEAAFATTGAATWKVLLASNCASDFTGCSAAVEVAAGAVTNPGGSEPSQLVTVPIIAASTWHRLTVEARDALGNKTSQTVSFDVTLSACIVSFTSLPPDGIYNGADCATPGCSSVSPDLTVQFVGPCNGVDALTLYKDGVPVGQATDLGAQQATFPLTLVDGEQATLWAELTSGGGLVAETGQFDVMVDLTDPSVAFAAGTVLGFTTPASGASVTWGMAADQTPGSTGTLEVHLRVTATDADAGRITALTATAGGGPVALAGGDIPVDVAGTPFTFDFQFVSLPDQGDYTVTVTLEDAAGNTAAASFQALVDISPPEEVVLEPIDAVNDVQPRLPAVTLKWQPPASNTGIAGGAASLYEVRYSTSPIDTEADWADACPAEDLPFVEELPAPGDPDGADMDTFVVRGPDPRSINTAACKFGLQPLDPGWYFAVRAQDGVGNWSPVTGAGAAFTDAATLSYAKITHSLAATNPIRFEDKVWAIGDINGDGYDDVALGGGNSSGFCIVYGADDGGLPIADLDLAASAGDGYQCFLDGASTGAGFPVVSAGDINGDGQPDLAVGAGWKPATFAEEVRLYLGTTGGGPIDGTPVAIIRGTSNNALYGYKNLASAGNFNGDVGTVSGLPLDDVIIPSGIGNKVFVVPGSEAFVAGSTQIIDLTSATDRATWNVVTVAMIGAAGNAYFGWSVAGGGDILPDDGAAYDEVVISMAKDPAQVVVLRGRSVSGDSTISLSNLNTGAQAGDATAVRLMPELGVGTNSFGQDLGTKVDLDGNGTPDIVANHQTASSTVGRYYTFFGEKLVGKEGQQVLVQPSGPVSVDGAQLGANGVMVQKQQNLVLPVGDFDGSMFGEPATVDLAYGVYSFTSYGKITIRLNHTGGAPNVVQGLLPFEDIVIRGPYEDPPSDKFGVTWAPIGDFNGDGLPDLVVGTAGQGWAVLVY